MLRTFIFNETKKSWIEEENLFTHDLCAILDEENRKIYLWNGPKSSKERINKANESLVNLLSNYPNINFQLIQLKKDIPNLIQKRLNKMMEVVKKEEEIEKYEFSKFTTIRLYFIFLIFSILCPILSIINLSSSLSWAIQGENFAISSYEYNFWLNISSILIIVSLIFFILNLIIGIYEYETQVIIFSLIGLVICIGISLYLQQGIFLFLFQESPTSTIYLINKRALFSFLAINIIGVSILGIPNILKLIFFTKTYRKFIF